MKGPPRLRVIEALYSLSPKAYDPLARMIVATAEAEAIYNKRRQTARNNRRLLKRRGATGVRLGRALDGNASAPPVRLTDGAK